MEKDIFPLALPPVCRTNLALVRRDELKGLEDPLSLVYRAAHGEEGSLNFAPCACSCPLGAAS